MDKPMASHSAALPGSKHHLEQGPRQSHNLGRRKDLALQMGHLGGPTAAFQRGRNHRVLEEEVSMSQIVTVSLCLCSTCMIHTANLGLSKSNMAEWPEGAPADEIKICLAGCWKANLETASDRKGGFCLLFEDLITIFTLGDGRQKST